MSGTHTYFELLGGGKNIIKNKFELDESRRGLVKDDHDNTVVVGDIQGGMYRLYHNPFLINEQGIENDTFDEDLHTVETNNGRPVMFQMGENGVPLLQSRLSNDAYSHFIEKVYEHSPPRWPFYCLVKLTVSKVTVSKVDKDKEYYFQSINDNNNTQNTVGLGLENVGTGDDDPNGAEGIILNVNNTEIWIQTEYIYTDEEVMFSQWWDVGDRIRQDIRQGEEVVATIEADIDIIELKQTHYMNEHVDLSALVPNGNALYISNNNTTGIENAFQPLEVYNPNSEADSTRNVSGDNLQTIVNPLNNSPISYRDGNNLLMQPEFRDFTTMYKYCAFDQTDADKRFNSLPLRGATNSIQHALKIISDDGVEFKCERLKTENENPPTGPNNSRPVWNQCKDDNSDRPSQMDNTGRSACPIADDALAFARKAKGQVIGRDNLEEHIVRWSEQNPTQSMYKKRYGEKKPQTQRNQNRNGNDLRTKLNKQVSINQHAFQKRVNTVHGRVNLSNDFYLSKNNMHRLVAGGIRNLFHRLKRKPKEKNTRFAFYRTTSIPTTESTFPVTIRFAELDEVTEGQRIIHFSQLVDAQPISLPDNVSRFHRKGVVNIEKPEQFVKMKNKYKSEVKHWISSGNTGGTYGVPALCAGANISRKGGTRPSKRVKQSGKTKQCSKLINGFNNYENSQKKQAKEEYNLRQCNNNNDNDMYKASNFRDFQDNRYRSYTIFEALDTVCVPYILRGGGLGNNGQEVMTKLEELILQYGGFNNFEGFVNYARGYGRFEELSQAMKTGNRYEDLSNNYSQLRRDFEAYLVTLLTDARSLAKFEGKTNVTGTHILQALYRTAYFPAYKKRINNVDNEFVVQVTHGGQEDGVQKYQFEKSEDHNFEVGDLIQIKVGSRFDNEASFLLSPNPIGVSATTSV